MKNLESKIGLVVLLLILNLGMKAQPRHLKQTKDPVRTSDNQKVDPDKNLDGSSGKYKDKHKHSTGKNFATRKRHIKTAKPGNGRESKKQKNPKIEKEG